MSQNVKLDRFVLPDATTQTLSLTRGNFKWQFPTRHNGIYYNAGTMFLAAAMPLDFDVGAIATARGLMPDAHRICILDWALIGNLKFTNCWLVPLT